MFTRTLIRALGRGSSSSSGKLAPHQVLERSRQRRGPTATGGSSAGGGGGKSYAERAAGPMASAGVASSVHMYANKENAWQGYTDDRFYGAKRLREYWRRLMSDRGVKYYFCGMIIALIGASAYLYQLEAKQKHEHGLLGPKKKRFRSRLTVIFDVDETILSYGDKAYRMKAGMVPRPYLAELLDYLSSIDAEVILWSACSDRYMRQVLGVIDPDGVRVSQYLTRDRDWFTNDHFYEKNILWLKRPLEDTLIIENRPLSVRNCNANAILVDDFIRGEYMDTGQDYPPNDSALLSIKHVIEDLEASGTPVPEYLQDTRKRRADIKEIPCHLAMRQMPDELARGVFFFVGDKFKPTAAAATTASPKGNKSSTLKWLR